MVHNESLPFINKNKSKIEYKSSFPLYNPSFHNHILDELLTSLNVTQHFNRENNAYLMGYWVNQER